MPNDYVENVIYNESLNDVNVEPERPLVDKTLIINTGLGLHKKRLEAECHDVSNVDVKKKNDVGQNEDKT